MQQYLNKILRGNSPEFLGKLSDNIVDAFITDPPYSLGDRTISEKTQDTTKKYEQSSNKIVHRPTFFW